MVQTQNQGEEQNISSVTSSNDPMKNNIFHRAGRHLWGREPVNTLSHTYFTTPKTHEIIRYVSMAFHVPVFIWALFSLDKAYYWFAYLTLWGFFTCMLYFILVHFVKQSHHSKKRWKFVYILGELGAVLEFLICPFFFLFLFPAFLKMDPAPSWQLILLQVLLHLVCPIFIWIETILNAIQFPKQHLWFVGFVCIVYPINNFLWSKYVMPKHYVYPVMDWKDYKTFLYIFGAIIMAFVGFYVGGKQHNAKKDRPFLKPKTPNEDVLTRLI